MGAATRIRSRLSTRSSIDWGTALIVLPGQPVSGDRHLVRAHPDGVLVAVVDGLGHGADAAAASDVALATLEAHISEPLTSLLKRCHEAMRSTRGAAMSLASFNNIPNSMTWLGVGNVEGVVLRANQGIIPARENIRLFPGVVGYLLPPLRAVVTPLSPGDLVIFFTDGVRADFLSCPVVRQSPHLIAREICSKYFKGNDDALVLVICI